MAQQQLDRESQFIEAFEKISEMADSDLKTSLIKSLVESLTIREMIEYIIVAKEAETGIDLDRFANIFINMHDFLGIPLNIPIGKLEPALSVKFERVQPMFRELGALIKCIYKTYNAS